VKIAVFGLGLIGGSLARDLAALGHTVTGSDLDDRAVDAALAEGVITSTAEDGATLDDVDVVILAVPVRAAASLLRALAPRLPAGCTVLDTGSTMRDVVAAAAAAGIGHRFVGCHPLAGDHRSGWAASRRGLFEGAPAYLSPGPDTAGDAVATAAALWRSVGAVPETMDAAAHDRRLAWTSHLPQLLATALALTCRDAGRGPAELGPGGRGMVRLAGSDAEMWTGILLHNSDEVLRALTGMQAQLDAVRAAIEAAHSDELYARFDAARQWVSGAPSP
jgi:prephenate dehydrogenase